MMIHHSHCNPTCDICGEKHAADHPLECRDVLAEKLDEARTTLARLENAIVPIECGRCGRDTVNGDCYGCEVDRIKTVSVHHDSCAWYQEVGVEPRRCNCGAEEMNEAIERAANVWLPGTAVTVAAKDRLARVILDCITPTLETRMNATHDLAAASETLLVALGCCRPDPDVLRDFGELGMDAVARIRTALVRCRELGL